MLSDSDSSDSDTGRRYKTESTRSREDISAKIRARDNNGYDDRSYKRRDLNSRYESSREYKRSRSRSPEYRRKRERSRSKSRGENSSRKTDATRDNGSSSSSVQRKHDNYEKSSKQRDTNEHKHHDKSSKDDRNSSQPSSSSKIDNNSHKISRGKSKDKQVDDRKTRDDSTKDHIDKPKKHKRDREPKRDRDERSSKHSSRVSSPVNENLKDDSTIANQNETENEKEADDWAVCGPALPPHMLAAKKSQPVIEVTSPSPQRVRNYGPSLPTDMSLLNNRSPSRPDSAIMDISDSDDDDFTIGPVLDTMAKKSEIHLQLERRALELKLAKLNERDAQDDVKKREEWMTELPQLRSVAGLGLKARQFRAKERDEIKDRSGWTDTPRDREEKSKRKEPTHEELNEVRDRKAEKLYRERRDAEQEAAIKKHKKKHKRDESLLEIHQKNLKKQKDNDKGLKDDERRPFSRETDLKVNRFDEAQKKSILKKAQLLDTRFGSGQSKFL